MKIIISIIVIASFAAAGCTETSTQSGGTTTTTTAVSNDPASQAAIAAAIQIATAAANAAIQTYLTTPAHGRLAANTPSIAAAKRSTEAEVRKAEPSLSPLQVHNIVSHAYAQAAAAKQ